MVTRLVLPSVHNNLAASTIKFSTTHSKSGCQRIRWVLNPSYIDLNIAVKTFELETLLGRMRHLFFSLFYSNFVWLKQEDNTAIYVNVRSLSNRLNIDQSMIRSWSRVQQLEDQIHQRSLAIQEERESKALIDLQRLELKNKLLPLSMLSSHAEMSTSTSLDQVIQAIISVVNTPLAKSAELFSLFNYNLILIKNPEIENNLNPLHSHKIYRYDPLTSFANGGDAFIFDATEIFSEKVYALKRARKKSEVQPPQIFLSDKNTINEYHQLKNLHTIIKDSAELPMGIQDIPDHLIMPESNLIDDATQSDDPLCIIIGKKYQNNLWTVCFDSKSDLFVTAYDDKTFSRVLYQLSYGLYLMHRHGFLHQDIKSENVLVEGGKAVLSDFGGVVKFDEQKTTLDELKNVIFTPDFVQKKDFEDLQGCSDLCEAKEIAWSKDVFSLGALFYESIIREEFKFYDFFKSNHLVDYETNYRTEEDIMLQTRNSLDEKGVPPALQDLILSMLSASRDKRPNAEKILEVFVEQYPGIHEEVKLLYQNDKTPSK